MTVQIGLAVKNFVGANETPDIDSILRYAERADQIGFESLWVWDHILLGVKPAFPVLESLSTLAAIATRTTSIKLGTGVLVLPLRNPVIIAKTLATVDQISRGRLLVGIGAGWYRREFDAVGSAYSVRGRVMERNIDLLLRLWTGGPVSVEIDEFKLRDAVQLPVPEQRPHPPILIGGYADAVLRRTARVGDGWLTYFYPAESFRRSWQKILRFAEEIGRDPTELTATNELAIYVGRSRRELQEPMREWLSSEWDTASWSESTIDHAICGSPQECIEELNAHIAAGVNRLVLIPYRYRMDQVEAIASEILPQLTHPASRNAPATE
jgi:alkanesulfonate monooxygenase